MYLACLPVAWPLIRGPRECPLGPDCSSLCREIVAERELSLGAEVLGIEVVADKAGDQCALLEATIAAVSVKAFVLFGIQKDRDLLSPFDGHGGYLHVAPVYPAAGEKSRVVGMIGHCCVLVHTSTEEDKAQRGLWW